MSVYGTLRHYDDDLEIAENLMEHSVRITVPAGQYHLEVHANGEMELHLPLRTWWRLRRYAPGVEWCLDLSDDELAAAARTAVKDRLAKGDPTNWVHRVGGSMVYGDLTDPEEEQVESYVRWYKGIRDAESKIDMVW